MICGRRGCDSTNNVVRFAPGIYLCLFHRDALLASARAGQKPRPDRTKEAHEAAVQAAGWVNPPEVRLVKGRVSECSGGLPGLGKDQ